MYKFFNSLFDRLRCCKKRHHNTDDAQNPQDAQNPPDVTLTPLPPVSPVPSAPSVENTPLEPAPLPPVKINIESSETRGSCGGGGKYNIVRNNLIVLSKLQQGEKLWLDNGILSIDTSYIPTYSRWQYQQSRKKILDQIEKDITYLGLIYEKLEHDEIDRLIEDAIRGLDTMKTTYADNIERIHGFIQKVKNIIPATET